MGQLPRLIRRLTFIGLALFVILAGRPVGAQAGGQYVLPGKPDGLGWYETATHYFVYVNHELGSGATTYLSSDTGSSGPRLKGARVSLLRFDKSWGAPAGKNVITQVNDGATTYVLDSSPAIAAYVDVTNSDNTLVFDRFCSGSLALTGFVDAANAAASVWFAPEETGNGRGYAVFPDGTAVALRSLGRFSKEQVLAAEQYRASNNTISVLLATEDNSDGELYMFVGQQTGADPNGFHDGQLYVLRLEDLAGNYIAREADMPAGAIAGVWTAVAASVDLDSAASLSAWVNGSERSSNFWRLEDIAEDPANPGTFYFTTTGGGDGNPDGMLHRLTLADPPTGTATVERLLVGSSSDTSPIGRRYDNVAVDGQGRVIIQEDGGGSEVVAYDIAGTGTTQLFDVNNNGWESSGVINHSAMNYLMSVQAHGTNVPNYGEAGALVLAAPAGRAPTPSAHMTDLTGGTYDLFDVLTVGTSMTQLEPAPTIIRATPTSPAANRQTPLLAAAGLLFGALGLTIWLIGRRRRVKIGV